MRVIIIEEKDSQDLLAQLELAKYTKPHDATESNKVYHDVHRHFHYVVTKWLQAQGADGIRR